MKDLREAIHNVLYYSTDVSLDGKKKYALVSNEHMKILEAEYNISFIEPEDKQFERPDRPITVEITEDNLRINP